MSKTKRRAQAARRLRRVNDIPAVRALLRTCPRCGEPGPHLVPPSFGDPGIWICETRAVPTVEWTPVLAEQIVADLRAAGLLALAAQIEGTSRAEQVEAAIESAKGEL